MSQIVTIRNRQRLQAVDLPLLRRMVRALLAGLPRAQHADLGIFLVAASEMIRLNETFLHHAGSTDVITFDYADRGPRTADRGLHGELFICMDEAICQARRFRTTWQSELVRYIVHGVLHLRGHDDGRAAARRKMKREENRLLRSLLKQFLVGSLARHPARAVHNW